MKYQILLLFALSIGSRVSIAQQNIDIGCQPKPVIQPDGSLQVTDCKGKLIANSTPDKLNQSDSASDKGTRGAVVNLPVDSPAAVAYQEYLEASYKYRTNSLRYATATFNWQYKASIAIFLVVIALVLTGLVFAGIQFTIAMRASIKANIPIKASDSSDNAALASTLDLSTHGVKITSSVIGLLILIVSLGFFYLYLVYVYPIQNIAK